MDVATKERITAHLATRIPGLRAVYLYGSQASGEAGPNSDVDLAVRAEEPLDPMTRYAIAGELAEQLGREVDLVDLSAVTTVFRARIITGGECLHGPGDNADYEARALSDYARLNEERKAILADITERGSIHGR